MVEYNFKLEYEILIKLFLSLQQKASEQQKQKLKQDLESFETKLQSQLIFVKEQCVFHKISNQIGVVDRVNITDDACDVIFGVRAIGSIIETIEVYSLRSCNTDEISNWRKIQGFSDVTAVAITPTRII